MRWEPFVVAVTAALAGCASPPPTMKPELSFAVPSDWKASDGIPGVVESGWIEKMGDPELVFLVGEAVVRNPDLKAAAARMEAAYAAARGGAAPLFPSLDVGLDVSKRQTLTRAPSGADTFDGFSRNRSSNVGLSLDLAWELDVWGRLRAGAEAGFADAQAAEAAYEYARLSLAAQTAKAWYQAVSAKLQLDLAQDTVRSFTETVELTESRFQRGLATALDIHLARADASTARTSLEQQELEYRNAVRTIETILGRYPQSELSVAGDLVATPPPVTAGVPSQILERRPDMIQAERALAAASRRLYEARAARLPRFSLTASGGTTSDQLQDIVDPKHTIWALAGNIMTPLFEGGRLSAAADRADAIVQEAAADYVSTALNAFLEVESALDAERSLLFAEEHQRVAKQEAWDAQERARERYQSGLGDFLNVLISQRRYFESARSFIQIRNQRLQNRINLHLALGGDFDGAMEPAREAEMGPPEPPATSKRK